MLLQRLGTVAVLLVISFTSMFVTCGERLDYPPPKLEYWFKAGVQLSPYRQDYKVGDTAWIMLSLPGKQLYDSLSGKTVHFDSASFTALASVKLLYQNPFIKDGPFASFVFPENISASTGNNDGMTSCSVTFGCAPSPDYSLRLGVVLLQKGAFEISFKNQYIANCFTGQGLYVQNDFSFEVPDSHLSFYQQLPLATVGLVQDYNVINDLQHNYGVAINVE